MPYVGFKSNTLRYSLNKIGKQKIFSVFYFSEGRVSYLDKSSQVRTYLLTIDGTVEEKNLYFQRGQFLWKNLYQKGTTTSFKSISRVNRSR